MGQHVREKKVRERERERKKEDTVTNNRRPNTQTHPNQQGVAKVTAVRDT